MSEEGEDVAQRIKSMLLSEDSPIDMTEEMKEKLEKLFEGYEYLSAEDREQFQRSMMSQLTDRVVGALNDDLDGLAKAVMMKNLTVLAAVLFLLLVFVFFGYKLYKSLKERERKRDEKRKLKQQKKRK